MSGVRIHRQGNVAEAAQDLFAQVSAKRDHIGQLDYGQTSFVCQFCDEHNCVEYMFGPRNEPAILAGSAHSIEELQEVIQAIVTMENIAFDMAYRDHSSIQLSA